MSQQTLTLTCEPPVSSAEAVCPACGGVRRPDWLTCFACAVGSFDDAAIERIRRERDQLAVWLVEAEQLLTRLSPNDPRRLRGMERWEQRLRLYRALCWICPEDT